MKTAKRKVRALSISGGGIKGIIPAYLLMCIEKKIQEATGRPEARIAHYIDLVSGTSVGGILATLYLTPINSQGDVRSAKEIYEKIAEGMKSVFHETPTGEPCPDPETSTQKSMEYFTELYKNQQLKELLKPTLITALEPNRQWMSFFRQQQAVVDPAANFLISDVCRSTGAMPVYFNPVSARSFSEKKISIHSFGGAINATQEELVELLQDLQKAKFIDSKGEIIVEMAHAQWDRLDLPEKWLTRKKMIYSVLERAKNPNFTFIDGAIFANNPSLCTMTEAANTRFDFLENQRPKLTDMILVSLGTGIKGASKPYSGKIDSGISTKLLSMMFGCAETLAHYQCYHIFSSAGVPHQYHYLDPVINPLPTKTVPNFNFYDTRQENIQALGDLAAHYADNHKALLDRVVSDLIQCG